MNEIFNKFLLVVDMLLSELHLWQTGFTYRVCDSFTKHPERDRDRQRQRERQREMNIQIQLHNKACFPLDATCGDSKDLGKIQLTVSHKIFKGKAYEILTNLICNEYQTGLDTCINFLMRKQDQERI